MAASEESLGRIGMVARWKPVHLGHTAVLHALVTRADHVLVGIGSSNRLNARNPFTAAETRDMLERVLRDRPNVTLFEVPDLDDDPEAIVASRLFGALADDPVPSAPDIGDAAFLLELGYRTFLLGDAVCLQRDSVLAALNLLEAVAGELD